MLGDIATYAAIIL